MTCKYCIYRFLWEVNERIDMLRSPSEVDSRDHEDHVTFRQEHDEQLLLWMQRYYYLQYIIETS